MEKKKSTNLLEKSMSKVLDATLRVNANSTSCMLIHEPKAPKGLEKFKKVK